MKTLLTFSSQTIKFLLQNFTVVVVYIGLYLNPCGLRKYSLILENSSYLHLSLNIMFFLTDGCRLELYLDYFKRFFTCRSSNGGFIAGIRTNNPYVLRMRFTALTEESWLNYQSINNSGSDFFGFYLNYSQVIV